MNIGRRLNKLEAERMDGGMVVVTVPVGMSKDEAMHQHFGEQGEPKNTLIVLIQKFSEALT